MKIMCFLFRTIVLLIVHFGLYSLYSQNNITGTIISDNEPAPYVQITTNQSNNPIYTDSLGSFSLNNVDNETILYVNSLGYNLYQNKIQDIEKPIVINLEKKSTILDEVLIEIVDSKWTKLVDKPKNIKKRPNSFIPLIGGFTIITKYVATKKIRFNGISFRASNKYINEDNNNPNKVFRPHIFKNEINENNRLIFEDGRNIEFSKKKSTIIQFEFNYATTLEEGDVVYFGIELLPHNGGDFSKENFVMLAPVKKEKLLSTNTAMYAYVTNPQDNIFGLYSKIELDSDLYFELKIVK